MSQLNCRVRVAGAVATVVALVLSGCGSAADEVASSATPTQPAATVEEVAPLSAPSVEITYEVEGESVTVQSELQAMGCTAPARAAVSPDGKSASALFPGTDASGESQMTASILGDELVAFRGAGTLTVNEASDGMQRVTVVDLPGTAFVADVPEGQSPSIGEVDLAGATEVPATMSATLDCPVS